MFSRFFLCIGKEIVVVDKSTKANPLDVQQVIRPIQDNFRKKPRSITPRPGDRTTLLLPKVYSRAS